MSDPPPPPQVSPDGKFYWDGQRWVLMPGKVPILPTPAAQSVGLVTHTTCLVLVGIAGVFALMLLLAGIAALILSR